MSSPEWMTFVTSTPSLEILWRTSKSWKYLVLTLQPQIAIAS
ncbi:MAG: hypothetical protein V7L27_05630 [Nostoc sp.]